MNTVHIKDLGTISYQEAWDLQEALMKEGLDVKSKRFSKDFSPDDDKQIAHHLLFCQHPHVYTLGKSGFMENLLVNNTQLQELGATFFKTNRGGDITYHGPGQMVVYPVLDLEQFFTDLGRYMRSLEEAVIQTIAEFGITGGRLEGATGVWLDAGDSGKARKICAMGVKCSRWLTIHGIALNVNTDLSYFGHIVPCGISDKGVTSMQQELGQAVDEEAVKKVFREKFANVFNVHLN
ncbi:MAG: lipoyl(octanoyl) transferase [Bacteroidetes bacterium 47-18]|nr:MAG: lipoyl(octanoyl) transferase [Bacteroidetes bacterium 47-18]